MASLHIAEERSTPGLVGFQSERRAHPRFFFQGTAVIRILPHGPDVLGALRDLSEGGCGIELGMAIPAQVGTHVEVSLHVDGMNLKRAGIIRRIDVIRRIERETRAGIQFMAGSGNGADMLRQLMKGVLPKADTNRQAGV